MSARAAIALDVVVLRDLLGQARELHPTALTRRAAAFASLTMAATSSTLTGVRTAAATAC